MRTPGTDDAGVGAAIGALVFHQRSDMTAIARVRRMLMLCRSPPTEAHTDRFPHVPTARRTRSALRSQLRSSSCLC